MVQALLPEYSLLSYDLIAMNMMNIDICIEMNIKISIEQNQHQYNLTNASELSLIMHHVFGHTRCNFAIFWR